MSTDTASGSMDSDCHSAASVVPAPFVVFLDVHWRLAPLRASRGAQAATAVAAVAARQTPLRDTAQTHQRSVSLP
jgi:hypothetical protein